MVLDVSDARELFFSLSWQLIEFLVLKDMHARNRLNADATLRNIVTLYILCRGRPTQLCCNRNKVLKIPMASKQLVWTLQQPRWGSRSAQKCCLAEISGMISIFYLFFLNHFWSFLVVQNWWAWSIKKYNGKVIRDTTQSAAGSDLAWFGD